jgi:hypothetical protein
MSPTLIRLWLALSGKPLPKAALRRRPAFRRPMLEALEARTLLATVTILGSHLVSASGASQEAYLIPGFLAGQGDRTVDLGPGTYSLEAGLGVGTFGTFTVSSQGTVDATTGALVATGNTIDFDLTQLAAITINAGDLTSPQGMPEQVGIYFITNNQHYNDTFYLPTGTYSLNTLAVPTQPAFGTFTVAQDASGSFVVSATTGALVTTGNTIDFNLTQVAAITIHELTDSTGVPESVNVDGVGTGGIGYYAPVNTFYLPTGTYTLETFAATTCGTFTVAQGGSGSFVISGTTGALVATGNSIVIDPTQLAAITINVVTDSNGSPEDGLLVGIAVSRLSTEHTYYVPTGTYEIENAAGTFYGTFTVSNNGPGSFDISGTTGALAANGNTIDFVNCALDHVTLTPNPGVFWTLLGVLGQSQVSDTVLVPDGSYTISFAGAAGGAGPATFSVGPNGLSDTELPASASLLSLKLTPCAPTLTSAARVPSGTNISGAYMGRPNTAYQVDFYGDTTAISSGLGQGETFLGSTSVTTDGNGDATFTATVASLPTGETLLDATATDPHGNTSAFSQVICLPPSALGNVFTVYTTADSGPGSLRQAILNANAAGTGTAGNPDEIVFCIPATDPGYNSTAGAFTIQPLSALPTLTDTAVLDGYTQPGASPNTLTIGDNAVLKIVLDGSQAGAVDGLVIAGGNSTVRGLVIDNFAYRSGIVLRDGGNDIVVGNFIGIDVTGASAAANDVGIVTNPNEPIRSVGERIGGTAPEDRNIISGNTHFGIDIDNGNLIQGNYVGTDRSGIYAVGNGTGIVVDSNNTIGGLTATIGAGAGNLISGNNVGNGIGLRNQNLVEGNLIGTDATGLAALGNGSGIGVVGNYNTIGGSTAAARNIISANWNPTGSAGIGITDGRYNLVEGNYVGTDITGTTALVGTDRQEDGIGTNSSYNTIVGNVVSGGNLDAIAIIGGHGHFPIGNVVQGNYLGTNPSGTQALPLRQRSGIILFGATSDTTIGGTLPDDGNVMAGNSIGIWLDGAPVSDIGIPTNNLIQGNFIGTDKTGTAMLGNDDGISLDPGNNNTIGGTASGDANIIAFNRFHGVIVDSGTGNGILTNSIHDNGSLGILLSSANNANDNQAAPVLTGLGGSAAGLTISGTLSSLASTTFRIEFFASPTPSDPANTEGKTLLGFTYVTTNGSGYAPINASGPSPIPAGEGYLTATATVATANGGGTYAFGDTSQFSPYLHVSYFFSGFLPPLSTGLSFALNRTIPIKFQLTDVNGNPVTSLSAVTSLQVAPVVNGVAGTPFTPTSTNNQGLESVGGQYLFTWQTRGLSAGTYEILLTLADGTTHTKTLQLTAPGSGSNAQAADGGDVTGGSTAGQVLGGDLEVYVSDPGGLFTADELAGIQDAVNAVDATVEPYGVAVTETTDPTAANVVIDTGSTSAVGGHADGVLGCYTTAGEVTLIQGWDWYAGADATQIGPGQFDFQTTLTHELGHALGLGESKDPNSAMYGTLAPGTAIRALTTADLNLPPDGPGADGQRAAVPTAIDADTAPPQDGREGEPVPQPVPSRPTAFASDHPPDAPRGERSVVMERPDGGGGRAGRTDLDARRGTAPAARATPAGGNSSGVPNPVAAWGNEPFAVHAAPTSDAWHIPLVIGAADLVPRLPEREESPSAVAQDAFFQSLASGARRSILLGAADHDGLADGLRGLAAVLGGGAAEASPVAANPVAGAPVLLALLAVCWGAQGEKTPSRRKAVGDDAVARDR